MRVCSNEYESIESERNGFAKSTRYTPFHGSEDRTTPMHFDGRARRTDDKDNLFCKRTDVFTMYDTRTRRGRFKVTETPVTVRPRHHRGTYHKTAGTRRSATVFPLCYCLGRVDDTRAHGVLTDPNAVVRARALPRRRAIITNGQ